MRLACVAAETSYVRRVRAFTGVQSLIPTMADDYQGTWWLPGKALRIRFAASRSIVLAADAAVTRKRIVSRSARNSQFRILSEIENDPQNRGVYKAASSWLAAQKQHMIVPTYRPAPALSGTPAERPRVSPSVACERRAVLDATGTLTDEHGRPPTRRELLIPRGLSSHWQRTGAITALEQTGRLRRLSDVRRLTVARPPKRTE